MADWSKPDSGGTDLYSSILGYINNKLNDVATLFSSAPTNPIDKMMKYVRASDKFQQYNSGAATWDDVTLGVAGGGTGAGTAAGARSNLGLGTLAVQDSNSVSITAGSITASVLSGVVPTANLGSGTANSGTYLRGDQSWVAIPAGIPTGTILLWSTNSAPSDYLICDGSAVNRTTYAALFSTIGVTYGSGNGSTTFNLPDLRGRFPLGKAASGTGNTLAASGGALDHTHTGPSHTHTGPSHIHTGTAANHTHGIVVDPHTHTGPSHRHDYSSVIQHTHTISITDPGHTHTYAHAQTTTGFSPNLVAGSDYAIGAYTDNTGSSTTGITASASSTGSASAYTGYSGDGTTGSGGGISTNTGVNNTTTYVDLNYSGTGDTGASGTDTTGGNNPAYLVLNYIIKV